MPAAPGALESYLRELRASGRPLLAPYLTAGFPDPSSFGDLVAGVVSAGADMLEIGVPFTDPLMDGPVIQRASDIALRAEVRPGTVLRTMAALDVGVPFVLMTYVNPVIAAGWETFAEKACECGASGVIVPDLPPEEGEEWSRVASSKGLAPVFLAAPTTPVDRIRRITELGGGFVYCVSLLGVTGVRDSLSDRARPLVERVRSVSDRPALVGVGVSTPEQAREACRFSDGVIVGSAVIRAALDGGPEAAVRVVAAMRRAIDG